MRYRIYGDVLPGAVIWCDSDRALAMNGMRHGHEWNGAMAINGMRHGHEWNGAMHGGHVGGAF